MTVRTPIETGSRGIPAWALGITVFVFLVGGVYFAGNLSGENPPIVAQPSPSGGGGGGPQQALAIIQAAGCQACHGPDLNGQGQFPSLHAVASGPLSANLQQLAADHPDDWANIWIAGTDPAVSDATLRAGMPAFAAPPYELTDEEIATVVDYLKTLP